MCCTCAREYPAFGKGCAQAGHYVPGRRNAVLYQEKGCHAQCFNCNVRLKSNPIEYRIFMDEKYGTGERLRQEALRYVTVKLTVPQLEAIRDKYEEKYRFLKENSHEI